MGVELSSAFFEEEGSVHLTSVFVHPVFVNDKGLNSIVNLDKSALLRVSLLNGFAKEAGMLTEAVIFSLGKVATAACEWLVANGRLDGARVLPGLQHPSPANRAHCILLRTEDERRNVGRQQAGTDRLRQEDAARGHEAALRLTPVVFWIAER